MNQNKQLMGVVLILLGLVCLLSVVLPAAYGFWSNAYLLSADVARPAVEGQLSEQAQEIPVVYALYRKRILSGFEMSAASQETDTKEQAHRLAELLEDLENDGVLPQKCREKADEIFKLPFAAASRQEEDGFQQDIYLGYAEAEPSGGSVEVMVQQHEQTGLVTACTVAGVQLQKDAAALLRTYCSYLGLDSLTDWQRVETQEKSAACWSKTGQLYLFCSLQGERFFIGAFSLSEEQLFSTTSFSG